MTYNPKKAHDYYERTKHLKGRNKEAAPFRSTHQHSPVGASKGNRPILNRAPTPPHSEAMQSAVARVGRLKVKVSKLEGSLTQAQQALSQKRRAAKETAKKNSDGKSTAAEKAASQKYRDKHQAALKAKAAQTKSSSSSSSASSSTSVSSMSVPDLEARVGRIQAALHEARTQLSVAQQAVGALSHSSMLEQGLLMHTITLRPTNSRKDSVNMTAEDFSGYATRNNLRCSDGRTILADAFAGNDGDIVPLVWQHGHDEPTNVLGHVKLENRADGVYCRGFFNSTAAGLHAKEMVRHGDVKFLSIFANQLVEKISNAASHAKDVLRGNVREVSLVLAGANPGAFIDNVNIVHSDDDIQIISEEAYITTGLEIELAHADSGTATLDSGETETVQDILSTLDEKQMTAVNYLLSQALTAGADSAGNVQHGDTDPSTDPATDPETDPATDPAADPTDPESNPVTDPVTDPATDPVTDPATDPATDPETDPTNQEDTSMTHNLFDQSRTGNGARPQVTLSHSDIDSIVSSAKKIGSLKEAVEQFVTTTGVTVDGTLQHGIENIDYLFPDSKTLENSPAFISRRMEWVDKVLSGVRKSPFSRIKTITADITPDEARARGYIKGNMKNEEFFALSKRETTPQTVYKKQKLDRDDVIDIVDLDVVAWLKAEMKVMLDEELAGAILVGDGRSVGDDDKIKETNIRPIATDAELYVTTANVNIDDANSSIDELVDAVITNRQYYKGSGTPDFFTTEGVISAFLTVKDSFGRRIYSSIQEVAAVLRVGSIVPVEVMERVPDLVGIMVNLSDYTLGADRGGQATMFDDFDIDYNKLRYLIETRVSGALTQPKSAIVFRKVAGSSTLVTPVEPARAGNTITVPTVTGVVYKDQDGTTLTTGSPVTLAEGDELHVTATPASGRYFADNANDEWLYDYDA